MPRNFFHTALFSSVAAMLAMLATTAHSTAIVRARVDPPAAFDIPVPGYDGYADFEVFPDGTCLSSDGWKSVNTSTSCGSVSMYDSVIYLYGEAVGDGPGNSAWEDTMRFESYPFAAEFATDKIFGIYVQGGEIKGIDMNPVLSYLKPSSGYEGRDFLLSLGTSCDSDPLCPGFDAFASLADKTDPGNGLRGEFTVIASGLDATGPRKSDFLDPTAIPEPGTLSLFLGALGGAWLARRRSKLTQ